MINNNKYSANQIPLNKINDYKNVNELKAKLIAPTSSAILKNKNNSNNNYDSNKVYVHTITRKIINQDPIQKSTQMNDSISRKQNNHNKYTTNEMHTNDSISYINIRNSKKVPNY